MSLKWNIKLYGSDTDVSYTGGVAAKADVVALVPDTCQIGVYWITPQKNLEGDTKETPGGRKFFFGKYRGKYELQTETFTIADFITKEAELIETINHNYTWFEVINYATDLHEANKLIPVVITGYDPKTSNGLKQFIIQMENSFV